MSIKKKAKEIFELVWVIFLMCSMALGLLVLVMTVLIVCNPLAWMAGIAYWLHSIGVF